MEKLNITFDLNGLVPNHPTYAYSSKEETVYTAEGWKIWAKDEKAARAIVAKEIRATWPTEYNARYTEIYGDTVLS